jgi:hypothetical protein
MAFFNNEAAYVLQYVTFPLEVIGLTLATIEVRFPSLAVRISAFIKGEWEELSRYPDRPVRGSGWYWLKLVGYWLKRPDTGLLVVMVSLVLVFLLLTLLASMPIGINVVVVAIPITEVALRVLPIIVICMAVWISATWVEDRAVGTMGIVIAGLGVLGEAYQFIVQLLAGV